MKKKTLKEPPSARFKATKKKAAGSMMNFPANRPTGEPKAAGVPKAGFMAGAKRSKMRPAAGMKGPAQKGIRTMKVKRRKKGM